MMTGAYFQATLPLAWLEQGNVSALEASRYLSVLAEMESISDERKLEHAELNAKLDLTLMWLARFFAGEPTPSVNATIGLDAMQWQSEQAQVVGALGAIALNLSSAFPFVLHLQARITACEKQGDAWQIEATLDIQDESLRDHWERTVFRRHRRAIQLQREAQA